MHIQPSRLLLRGARAGFTLIELLAVMLIISILAFFLLPQIPAALDRANVTACKANMGAINQALLMYHMKYKRMPRESGVGFFAALIADKVWESTPTTARRLTCPGVEIESLPGIAGIPEEEWYIDRDLIDGSYSAYAGRNMQEYAFRKFPISGMQALVADDNDPEGNHRTATVVLWGDGSAREYQLVEAEQDGLIDREAEFIIVGPESPIEALQRLSLD
ncbi:MAG: prepilin-type N-terminal cleavage/methylation domain-containing protein [Planctomycetota bacterium]|nr:MAG: prepilin-type N-terminal cleavage/methylation domain-containing protein [Planctomycetota bacterium]